MIKTGIFGDFSNGFGSSPSSGASPSTINKAPQTQTTENIKKGKSSTKKTKISTPGVHPGRQIDWKKRAEKAAAHAAEIARRKAERHQKTLERRAARKAEHQKEVAKRRAERHQKTLERRAARKDYVDWWKANTKTNKQIAREAEKEATKRAKAIAKAEDKAYKKWWKDQEKAKEKEIQKEIKKREKAIEKAKKDAEREAEKAEKDAFMEDIKEALDQFEKWRKEGKYDAEIFKQALGDIKGLVLTKEGRISRKSDVRDPWIRKALLGRASSTSRFEYHFQNGKYSLRERFKNTKYRARDLFEYFLDASELEDFGYSKIYNKFEDIQDALLEHNLVEARDLLDELDEELIAVINKASDLIDYREGLGQSVHDGVYTRTKFYKTSDYDSKDDYIDF